MPLRWKKTTRCTRFSQLVADHLQSRKRGGSLVVETGFPTSLIDLYVRNRGRLRRFYEKKQSGNDLSTNSPMESLNSSSVDLDYRGSDEIVETGVTFDVDVNAMDGNLSEKIENSNWVLVAALKVLLMAVLALGTKRFTVGITVSAFLLYFVEFVGKPWMQRLRLFRPCLDPRKLFKSHFHGTRKIKSLEVNWSPVVCNEALEIEEVVEDSKEEKESYEVRCEVSVEVMPKNSRRAKIKSKMLKLLPKKLRTSKKGCLDSKHGITCGFKEEDTGDPPKKLQTLKKCCLDSKREIPCGFKEEDRWDSPKKLRTSKKFCLDSKSKIPCGFKGENTGDHDNDLNSQSLPSVLSSESSNEEQDKLVRIERSVTWSNEIDHDDKELGRETQENSGYLVLCLIVLVGLVGGRILALVLAVSWCLMLKKTQRRHVKLPIS